MVIQVTLGHQQVVVTQQDPEDQVEAEPPMKDPELHPVDQEHQVKEIQEVAVTVTMTGDILTAEAVVPEVAVGSIQLAAHPQLPIRWDWSS